MKELHWRDILTRTILMIITVTIVVWSMPHDSSSYYFVEEGKPWKYADFTAPFDFPIYKSEAVIREERDSALSQYEPYYKYNQAVEQRMVQKFNKDYADGIPDLPASYMSIISNRLQSLYQQGIIDQKEYTTLMVDTSSMIRIVNDKQASSVSVMEVYSPKVAYEQLFQDAKLAPVRSILQKCNLNEYIARMTCWQASRWPVEWYRKVRKSLVAVTS